MQYILPRLFLPVCYSIVCGFSLVIGDRWQLNARFDATCWIELHDFPTLIYSPPHLLSVCIFLLDCNKRLAF